MASGHNFYVRYPGAEKVPGDVITEKVITGPLAAPGSYQVRLTVGDRLWTQPLEVRKDPRVPATQAALDAQFALWSRIRDTCRRLMPASTACGGSGAR